MAIEFVCPACGGGLQVGDEVAGRVIRCGGCMTALRVPIPESGPRPAPASPFETDPPDPRRSFPADVEPLPDDGTLPTARRVDSGAPPATGPTDRPRRTRRRRPPPPNGNRVLLWVLIAGGVGLFGLLACCGGVLLMMPKPHWHTHKSEAGGFEAQFPSKVRAGTERAAFLKLEDGERSEGALLPFAGEQFIVIYKDIPGTKDRSAKNEKSDAEEIDELVQKMLLDAPEAKLHSDTALVVGGFPAREVEVWCVSGWYAVRIIVADTRVYSLVVHSADTLDRDATRRFIDSFVITDEALAKRGKEREAEAARIKERDDKRRAAEEGEQARRAGRAVAELALAVATGK